MGEIKLKQDSNNKPLNHPFDIIINNLSRKSKDKKQVGNLIIYIHSLLIKPDLSQKPQKMGTGHVLTLL